jgi:hypothetical protein
MSQLPLAVPAYPDARNSQVGFACDAVPLFHGANSFKRAHSAVSVDPNFKSFNPVIDLATRIEIGLATRSAFFSPSHRETTTRRTIDGPAWQEIPEHPIDVARILRSVERDFGGLHIRNVVGARRTREEEDSRRNLGDSESCLSHARPPARVTDPEPHSNHESRTRSGLECTNVAAVYRVAELDSIWLDRIRVSPVMCRLQGRAEDSRASTARLQRPAGFPESVRRDGPDRIARNRCRVRVSRSSQRKRNRSSLMGAAAPEEPRPGRKVATTPFERG